MNRRSFLKLIATTAAGLAVPLPAVAAGAPVRPVNLPYKGVCGGAQDGVLTFPSRITGSFITSSGCLVVMCEESVWEVWPGSDGMKKRKIVDLDALGMGEQP